MWLEQFLLFSSDHPPWMAFFEGSSEHAQTVAGRVFKEAMSLVGGRLLDCQSPNEVEITIDELLADPHVSRAIALIAETMQTMPTEPAPSDLQLSPDVERFLGASAARIIGSALPEFVKQAEAHAAYMNFLSAAERESAIEGLKMDLPLDSFVTDESIPVEIRSLMLKGIIGSICGMATAVAISKRRRISDWLGLDLAERVVYGLRCYLRFLGSIPDLGISTSHTIDLEKVFKEHHESQLALRLSLLRHRASGKSISIVGETPDGQ